MFGKTVFTISSLSAILSVSTAQAQTIHDNYSTSSNYTFPLVLLASGGLVIVGFFDHARRHKQERAESYAEFRERLAE